MPPPVVFRDEHGTEREVEVRPDGSIAVGEHVISVREAHAGEIRAGDRTVWAAGDGDRWWIFVDGYVHVLEVQRSGQRVRRAAASDGNLTAPMPATVIRILASAGDRVKAGDTVMILEAMKMELPVRAAIDGVVTAVRCREGALVQPGQELIVITEAP